MTTPSYRVPILWLVSGIVFTVLLLVTVPFAISQPGPSWWWLLPVALGAPAFACLGKFRATAFNSRQQNK